MTARLSALFTRLRAENRAGFVAYMMGGDPDLERSWALLDGLPRAGADIVELGFPFTDPTADGPVIEAAGRRALAAGVRLNDVLDLGRRFRDAHPDTPLILMGYANPLHHRGFSGSAQALADAGADGVIVVDLPPEEDAALDAALAAHDLALIKLAAPTSDASRLTLILEKARGFVYYIAVAGVTGTTSAAEAALASGVAQVRAQTDLPVAAGFGVRTPDQAAAAARSADAVVVGTAIVAAAVEGGTDAALDLTRTLADAVRNARA